MTSKHDFVLAVFQESEVSGNDLTLIDLDDPINDGDVMKEEEDR